MVSLKIIFLQYMTAGFLLKNSLTRWLLDSSKVRGLGLGLGLDVFSRTIGLANLRIIEPSDYRYGTGTLYNKRTNVSATYHRNVCSDCHGEWLQRRMYRVYMYRVAQIKIPPQ